MNRHSVLAVATVTAAALSACSFSSSGPAPLTIPTSAVSMPLVPPGGRPDGVVAFRRFTDASLTSSHIVSARLDGSQQQDLTPETPGVRDTVPAWSHDGKQLAFMRLGPGPSSEVYIVGSAGGQIRQLTHSPSGETCGPTAGPQPAAPTSNLSCNGGPAWSPDGRTVAYDHVSQKDSVLHSGIWVTSADGTGAHPLSDRGKTVEGASPSWSPDGQRIVFERSGRSGTSSIFTVGIDGSDERQLTPGDRNFGDHAAWSPDGTRVVFRSDPDDPTQGFQHSDLWTVRPDGTGLRQVTHSGQNLEYLSSSWSPDSKWIVTGLVDRASHNAQAQLCLVNPITGQRHQVVDNVDWQSAPRWSPASSSKGP